MRTCPQTVVKEYYNAKDFGAIHSKNTIENNKFHVFGEIKNLFNIFDNDHTT